MPMKALNTSNIMIPYIVHLLKLQHIDNLDNLPVLHEYYPGFGSTMYYNRVLNSRQLVLPGLFSQTNCYNQDLCQPIYITMLRHNHTIN